LPNSISTVNRSNGEKELVLAGGARDVWTPDTISSTKIYSLSSNTWRDGPDLPRPMSKGASVQYGDSFLVVHITGIFMYDLANDDWNDLLQKFPSTYNEHYNRFSAVLVAKNVTKCK
jgi:hypothetical protein